MHIFQDQGDKLGKGLGDGTPGTARQEELSGLGKARPGVLGPLSCLKANPQCLCLPARDTSS